MADIPKIIVSKEWLLPNQLKLMEGQLPQPRSQEPYTLAEIRKIIAFMGDEPPPLTRGIRCGRCLEILPLVKEYPQLYRGKPDKRIIAAVNSEMIKESIPPSWRRIVINHFSAGPRPQKPPPANCLACGGALATKRSKLCLHCEHSWHDSLLKIDPDSPLIWHRSALTTSALQQLDKLCPAAGSPGERLTLTADITKTLLPVTTLAQDNLSGARPVRVVTFNKDDSKNWQVGWHQDRVIAVAGKHQKPGFKNWTRKRGIWHVEPPLEILQNMLFARIHLDDQSDADGAMQLAAGSHVKGPIAEADAELAAKQFPLETGDAARGDVLLAPMLTLHRSRPSQSGAPRRTIRVDYAAQDLFAPLKWSICDRGVN